MKDNIKIINYKSEYKQDYIAINEAWIKEDYELEALDIQELCNPEDFILKKGGAILLAMLHDKVVGTCALQYKAEGVFEMIKMAVDKQYRGLGIGKQLCEAIIDKAKALHAEKIILYSNTKTAKPAIALYRKYGFNEIPLGETDWDRADIKMEMALQ